MAHNGEFRLRCFGCYPSGSDDLVLNIAHTRSAEMLGGLSGWKAPLSRLMAFYDSFFAQAIGEGGRLCSRCGTVSVLRPGLAGGLIDERPEVMGNRGVHVRCERCGETDDIHLLGLALFSPAGRRFWKQHPRLVMRPVRTLEAQGRAAIVVTFESVTERVALDVVLADETYQVLGVYGASGA